MRVLFCTMIAVMCCVRVVSKDGLGVSQSDVRGSGKKWIEEYTEGQRTGRLRRIDIPTGSASA